MEQYIIDLVGNITNGIKVEQTFWDYIVDYILPSITCLALLISSIGGYLKYRDTKNKELYEKILSEVYSPLYQYFIKQEIFCAICIPERKYKETPILDFTKKKVTNKFNFSDGKVETIVKKSEILNLTRKEFINVKNSIRVGLASKELLTLLNMYEVLIYFEEEHPKSSDSYIKATTYKVDVENAIRMEIFQGYKKYHKKLGLIHVSKPKLWDISEDNVTFNINLSEEEIKELKETIDKHPDKYTND